MADWGDLIRELDLWGEAGEEASLWWRDDDAVGESAALRDLRHNAQVPIALAVIPARLQEDLGEALADWPLADLLQHGYAHLDHARPGERKSEFPENRAAIETDLAAGRQRLAAFFGDRFRPVLVPPWNRMAESLVAQLPDWGFSGLSRFGPRRPDAVPGLIEVNTHVDLVDWRGDRGFPGEAFCLARLIGHLAARRQGAVDRREATGILTHHLVHQKETWRFLENLQDCLRGHGSALFLGAAQLFAGAKIR